MTIEPKILIIGIALGALAAYWMASRTPATKTQG